MMSEPETHAGESERLLERLRAGDTAAADELFAFHRGYLVRLAQSHLDDRLSPRLDASDVVQEALQEAAQRLEDYLAHAPVPFAWWLRQIVLDRVHKAWRRHGRAQRRDVRKDVPFPDRSSLFLARQLSLAHPASTPSQQLSHRELARRVRHAMARISGVSKLFRNVPSLTR